MIDGQHLFHGDTLFGPLRPPVREVALALSFDCLMVPSKTRKSANSTPGRPGSSTGAFTKFGDSTSPDMHL